MKKPDLLALVFVAIVLLPPLAKAGNDTKTPESAKGADKLVPFVMSDPEGEKEDAEYEAKLLVERSKFTEAYKKATTPAERMALCVDAIDRGLIDTGRTPVDVVYRMFGAGAGEWNHRMAQSVSCAKGQNAFIIHFTEYRGVDSKEFVSGKWFGWYLYVRYHSDVREQPGLPEIFYKKPVMHFYLSNTWELTKGFEP